MPPKIKPKANAPRRGAAVTAAAAAAATGENTGGEGASTASGTTTGEPKLSTSSTAIPIVTTRAIAPPIGRLDSLRSTVGGPAGSSSNGGPAGTGPGRRKAPMKFKVKAGIVRKSAEERAALEAKVAPTTSVPSTEFKPRGGGMPSRGPRGGGRGRGGRGGGRGGFNDRGPKVDFPSTASGPFALGSVMSGRSKVIIEKGAQPRQSQKHSFKTGSKSSKADPNDPTSTKIKQEEEIEIIYSSSDEEDSDGPRINVERLDELLYDIDDSDREDNADDDDGTQDRKPPIGKMAALFPLRVDRTKHEERIAPPPIFRDPEIKKKKSKPPIKSEDPSDSLPIKPEPTDPEALPDAPSLPPSPELKKASASSTSISLKETLSSPELTKKSPLEKRRKSSSRKRRPALMHTAEEEMEVKREEEDRIITLHELGITLPDTTTTTRADDDDADMLDPDSLHHHHQQQPTGPKSGDLFMFQFPTILPPLIPFEPQTTTSTTTTTAASSSEIKPDPDPVPVKPKPLTSRHHAPTPHNPHSHNIPPPGLAGRLQIHKSGKITMIWGNPNPTPSSNSQEPGSTTTTTTGEPITMHLTRGSDCEFLQEVVVIKPDMAPPPSSSGPGEEEKGTLWSLGQVKGRFVVGLDWGELLSAGAGAAGAGGGAEAGKR